MTFYDNIYGDESPKALKQKDDFWFLSYRKEVIAIEPQNPVYDRAFIMERFEEIFPKYNPRLHTCETQYMNDNMYFTLSLTRGKNDPIPNGIYRISRHADFGIILQPFVWLADDWVSLDGQSDTLLADIKEFIATKNIYANLGLRYRRAALLYGPPGNGKTTAIYNVINSIDECIVLILDADIKFDAIQGLREVLTDRLVVFVFEELTERATEASTEGLLSFLDGEQSWANCYTIATTNYPKELPENIVDRPGRFELILEFKPPNEKQRKTYLGHFGIADDLLVKETAGLSLDYLRYIVLKARVTNKSERDVLVELQNQRKKISQSFKQGTPFGF